jgi:hypothetical protein
MATDGTGEKGRGRFLIGITEMHKNFSKKNPEGQRVPG